MKSDHEYNKNYKQKSQKKDRTKKHINKLTLCKIMEPEEILFRDLE